MMAACADNHLIRNTGIILLFHHGLVGCTSREEYLASDAAQWAFANGMMPGFCGYVHGIRDSQDEAKNIIFCLFE